MRHADSSKVTVRNPHVHRLQQRQFIGTFVKKVGHLEENLGTLLMMHSRPRTVFTCLVRSLDGGVGILRGCPSYIGNCLFRSRIDGGHSCAVRRITPFPGDQELSRRDLLAVRSGWIGLNVMKFTYVFVSCNG